jgi:hypothetical protein
MTIDRDKLEAVAKRMKSVRDEASSPGGVNIGKLNAAKQAYDDATDYPEILALLAEVRALRERLEIDPGHPYDGIYCRDETIRLQGEEIDRLREIQAANVEIKMALHMKTLDLAEEKIALQAEVRALREAGQGVLDWTESRHRPPVPEALPSGETAHVRVHALVKLHKVINAARGAK